MSLRTFAAPLLGLAQRLYRTPSARRLMVELRESFDDRVRVMEGEPPVYLHVTSRMEHQRATGFLSKEPDTIVWLNQLNAGDLFVDIGANVGVYSLYAAMRRSARVIAFEPEAQNFAALNRNLWDNKPPHRVTALPYALSDRDAPIQLHLAMLTSGGSHHTAGEAIDEQGRRFTPKYVQDTVATTLDAILKVIAPGQCPRFIKIDVDGSEPAILAGMPCTLADKRLEQVLVEMPVDPADAPAVYEQFRGAGFSFQKPGWVNKGRGNIIFTRRLESID